MEGAQGPLQDHTGGEAAYGAAAHGADGGDGFCTQGRRTEGKRLSRLLEDWLKSREAAAVVLSLLPHAL